MTVPGNFEVRNPEVEKQLNDLGNLLRTATPPGYGFALLIVKFGEGGDTFYTSNCDRQDMCNLMREFIQKAEKN